MDSKGRYYALDKRFPWSRGVVFLISIVAVVVVCVLLISGIDASREANRLRKENRALRQEKTILADSLTVYRMRADFMKSFSSSSVSWDSVDYVHQKLLKVYKKGDTKKIQDLRKEFVLALEGSGGVACGLWIPSPLLGKVRIDDYVYLLMNGICDGVKSTYVVRVK